MQENIPSFIALTIFWSIWTSFTFKWSICRCQILNASCTVNDCTKLVASAACTFTKLISHKIEFTWCNRNKFIITIFSNAFILVELDLQIIGYKFPPRTNWHAIRDVKHIFNTNSVDATIHDCYYDNNLIPVAWTILLLSKYTLHEMINSYVSNLALCKVMCLEALKSTIYFYKLLDCTIVCITNA